MAISFHSDDASYSSIMELEDFVVVVHESEFQELWCELSGILSWLRYEGRATHNICGVIFLELFYRVVDKWLLIPPLHSEC